MAYSEALAGRIRRSLARRRDVEEKKLFGGIGYLLHGKVCVGVWKDALIARIGPERAAAALDEPNVAAFAPTGRPMKGWILVAADGVADDARLDDWIRQALEFVATLPDK